LAGPNASFCLGAFRLNQELGEALAIVCFWRETLMPNDYLNIVLLSLLAMAEGEKYV
jgi:hypothetical protein